MQNSKPSNLLFTLIDLMEKKTGTTEGWLELLINFWVVFDVSPGSGNRCTLWLMVAESGFLPQPVVRWMVLPSPVDQPASFSSAAAESRPPVCTEVAPQRERRPPKKNAVLGQNLHRVGGVGVRAV